MRFSLEMTNTKTQTEMKRGYTSNIKYIVVHNGDAHWDDMLAAGFALYRFGREIPIFRRQPTDEELDDPSVLILDVGGRYEPEKNNFDHHKLAPEQMDCALTLFMREHLPREYDLLRLYSNLLDVVTRMDILGPNRFRNDQPVAMEILEPLDCPIRRMFEGNHVVETVVKDILIMLVKIHLQNALQYQEAEKIADQGTWIEIRGVRVLFFDVDQPKLKHVLDRRRTPYDVLVLPDQRGPGWMLFRNNDHRRVNLAKIANEPDVLFAHQKGFISKTKDRCPWNRILQLLEKAIS